MACYEYLKNLTAPAACTLQLIKEESMMKQANRLHTPTTDLSPTLNLQIISFQIVMKGKIYELSTVNELATWLIVDNSTTASSVLNLCSLLQLCLPHRR